MNGYCKHECMFTECKDCGTLFPIIDMNSTKYGHVCDECELSERQSLASQLKKKDHSIEKCRICGVASESGSKDCEEAHFTKLSYLLPVSFDSRGARILRLHNQNFDGYTPYGKILVIACYLQSEIPPKIMPEYSRLANCTEAVSSMRVVMADALQYPDHLYMPRIATLSRTIQIVIDILFMDCFDIRMRCHEYLRDIVAAASIKSTVSATSSPLIRKFVNSFLHSRCSIPSYIIDSRHHRLWSR